MYQNTQASDIVRCSPPECSEREKNIKILEDKYQNFKDKQGIMSDRSDTVAKAALSSKILISKKAREEMDKTRAQLLNPVILYKEGKKSFEEASREIDAMDKGNEICVNLFSNITASFLATAAGLAVRGRHKDISFPAVVVIGTVTGTLVNVAMKFLDRKMNNIEGDEFDLKQIAKDAASGAFNGLLSGINAGSGKEFTVRNVLKKLGVELGKQGAMIASVRVFGSRNEDKSA